MAYPDTILHKNVNNMIIKEAKIWVKSHKRGKTAKNCAQEEAQWTANRQGTLPNTSDNMTGQQKTKYTAAEAENYFLFGSRVVA